MEPGVYAVSLTPQQVDLLDIKAAWRVRANASRFLDKIEEGWRFESASGNEPMRDVTDELKAQKEAIVRDGPRHREDEPLCLKAPKVRSAPQT